jgi:uncharacterized protein (TIGR03083 family)
MQSLHAEIGPLLRALDAAEWAADSACAGWRVQDVVAHMGATMKLMVDPDPMPPLPEGVEPPGAEQAAEAMVSPRKQWTPEEVLAEFEHYRDGFLAFLAAVQEEPAASAVNDLGDLGSHPTHIFSDMFCFDHYCHVVFDICAPDGPVTRTPPAPDHDVLGPAVEWMLAGLPAMCRDQLTVTAPLVLELTGAGGGSWLIGPPDSDGLVSVAPGSSGEAAASVHSTAHDFVSWGTKRSDWRSACRIEGDAEYAATVLDAINVI